MPDDARNAKRAMNTMASENHRRLRPMARRPALHRWAGPIGSLVLLFALASAVATAAESSRLKVWVVEASSEAREKRHVDPGLEDIARVLVDLPHDTFRKAAAGTHTLRGDQPTKIPLVAGYTLESAEPVARTDGRYRIRLRILMKNSDDPPREIEALSTELLLRPEKQVLVRGLKGKERGEEILLVLCLSVPAPEKD